MTRTILSLLTVLVGTSVVAQFSDANPVFESDVKYPRRLWFDDLNGDSALDAIAMDGNVLSWWPNNGQGDFPERRFIFSQQHNEVHTMSSVDLDGDGDKDILTSKGWWANDGIGHFTFMHAINTYLVLVTHGDVDGDGDIDLIARTGVQVGNIVVTFFGTVLNDGLGNFSDGFSLGPQPTGTMYGVLHDLDGDGDQDLVLGGQASYVGYYPNLGGGTFGARVSIPLYTGGRPHVADMDGDGDADLVVAGASPGARWFANNGSAVFAIADTLTTSTASVEFFSGDVTGDGAVDHGVSTGTTCNARLGINGGDGLSWTTLVLEDFAGYNLVGTRYAFADVDGDGDTDVGIIHGLGMIAWYPNAGGGTFGARRRIGHVLSGGAGLSVVDLDGDGDLDVAAAANYGDWITLYRNQGNGTFDQQEVVMEHLDQVSMCRAADLNGDGIPELFTNKPQAAILWNNGTGQFTPATLPNNGTAILAADLDGDQDQDLIGTGLWYRNDGGGLFAEVAEPLFAIAGAPPRHAADLNGDGIVDVLCSGNSLVALINDGNGVLAAITSTTSAPIAVGDVADMDQDGDRDLVALIGTQVHAFLNDGTGSFTQVQLTQTDVGMPRHIVASDLNADGYPDVVWARSNGYDHKTFANLNNGDGTLGGTFIVDPIAESTDALAMADINGDLVPDLVASRFHSITWRENLFYHEYRAQGEVFKDFDQDGARDPLEPPQAFAPIRTDPAGVLSWTNSFGRFDLAVDSGTTYQLWPQLPFNLQVTTTPDTAVFQANDTTPIVDSLDFGIGPVVNLHDPALHVTHGALRCDSETYVQVDVDNVGSSVLTGVTVQLQLDPDVLILASLPPADSIVANTIHWSLDSLPWFAIRQFAAFVRVGPVGSSAQLEAEVRFDSTSDTLSWLGGTTVVSCAYDPNDKQVLPEGVGIHHAIPIDQEWLDYTIRFQNTGTDTAFHVLLIDRLSDQLDWASMEILGTSHALTDIHIETDGALHFRYAHINLPDSGANMAGSQGFVRFRMRPLPGVPHLTIIANSAEIYFDLNPAVITNTVFNTLVDCGLHEATITAPAVDLLEAGPGEAYQWFLNGQALPGATTAQLVPVANGDYTVQVTTEYGCVALSDPYTYLSTSVPAGEDAHGPLLVPNPMDQGTVLWLGGDVPAGARVELLDATGRVVRTWSVAGDRLPIERQGLEAGVYMLHLHGMGAGTHTLRLVVR